MIKEMYEMPIHKIIINYITSRKYRNKPMCCMCKNSIEVGIGNTIYTTTTSKTKRYYCPDCIELLYYDLGEDEETEEEYL